LDSKLSPALLAEVYGTFLLTFIGSSAVVAFASNRGVLAPGPTLGLGFIGLAFGGALLAGIATVSHISGAHFNPAVTIALASRGKFPKNRVIPYIAAQFVGASIAGFLILGMVGVDAARNTDVGNTVPNASLPLPYFSALLAEIVGTMVLVMTIQGATDENSRLPWGPAAIGVSLSTIIWALGSISGASLNPARTFGSTVAALVFDQSAFNSYWIYVLGPILGGLLAAQLYRLMSGR
jgi:glycerol uptake facilitator protein